MQPPELSSEQRSAASAKAVANRRRRSEVKARIRDGEISWTQLLELARTDEVVAAILVREALLAFPGVGPKRADRWMTVGKVSATRRLRGLGSKQISVLNEVVDR